MSEETPKPTIWEAVKANPWLLLLGGASGGGLLGTGLTASFGPDGLTVAQCPEPVPLECTDVSECPPCVEGADLLICERLNETLEGAIRGMAYACRPAPVEQER